MSQVTFIGQPLRRKIVLSSGAEVPLVPGNTYEVSETAAEALLTAEPWNFVAADEATRLLVLPAAGSTVVGGSGAGPPGATGPTGPSGPSGPTGPTGAEPIPGLLFGINSNSSAGHSATWTASRVLGDRSNALDIQHTNTPASASTAVGNSLALGCKPLPIINTDDTVVLGKVVPATYAANAVAIIERIIADHPTVKVFQLINEPYYKGSSPMGSKVASRGKVYGEICKATYKLAQERGLLSAVTLLITTLGKYNTFSSLANEESQTQSGVFPRWVTEVCEAFAVAPDLRSLINGWATHPYGSLGAADSLENFNWGCIELHRASVGFQGGGGANNWWITEIGWKNDAEQTSLMQPMLEKAQAAFEAGWLKGIFLYDDGDGEWTLWAKTAGATLRSFAAIHGGTAGSTGATGAGGTGAGATGATGPVGPTGATGPAAWAQAAAWVSGSGYSATAPAAVVTDAGATYLCILTIGSSTTKPGLDATHWLLLAEKGATGPAGGTGSAGPAGATGPTGAGVAGATGPSGPARRIRDTFSLNGSVTAQTYPGFFVSLAPSTTAKIVKLRYRIRSGTSLKFKLQKNGVDIEGAVGLEATTAAASTTGLAVSVAEDDEITLVVESVSGSPSGLSVSIFAD